MVKGGLRRIRLIINGKKRSIVLGLSKDDFCVIYKLK